MNKNNENSEQDLLRLNALVDGELAPSERAQIAARMAADRNLARGHATLARLKAAVMETADFAATDAMRIAVPGSRPRPRMVRRLSALAASATLFVAAIAGWHWLQEPPRATAVLAEQERLIAVAAMPVRPVVPDFAPAGLTLVGTELRGRVLVATYAGPRGCRLELRVSAVAQAPQGEGSRRHAWRAGPLSYELVAFGMPETRFAIIVGAAVRQTRLNLEPDVLESQLREARVAAPPCVG